MVKTQNGCNCTKIQHEILTKFKNNVQFIYLFCPKLEITMVGWASGWGTFVYLEISFFILFQDANKITIVDQNIL